MNFSPPLPPSVGKFHAPSYIFCAEKIPSLDPFFFEVNNDFPLVVSDAPEV